MKIAKFVDEVTVIDPDTKLSVEVEIFKHPNGGMIGIDSSFLDQCTDDDNYPVVLDPFVDIIDKDNLKYIMLSY